MYCIEESTCDTVWTFCPPAVIWRPHGDSAPGALCPPFPPRYSPTLYEIGLFFHKFISLMPDDSLERKGSSENRNAIWKTYN